MDAPLMRRLRLLAMAGLTAVLLAGCSGGVPGSPGSGASSGDESASAAEQTGSGEQAGSTEETGPGEPSDPGDVSDMPEDGEPGGLIINPTSEPPPPPPEPPQEMAEVSDRGAVAAAGYYLNLMSYAFVTGQVEPMTEMSSDGCEGCATLLRNIETMHDNGGRVAWPSLSMDHVVVDSPDSPDSPEGTYVLTFNRHNQAALYMPGEKVGTALPSVYHDEVLQLRHVDGAWQVVEYRLGEPDMSPVSDAQEQ